MSQPTERRLFAVIPAAGQSRRMGQPKLLLPFGGTTVIARLLATLHAAAIEKTVVLARPDDEVLREEIIRAGARAIQPDSPPPEMRVSVEHLLHSIKQADHPLPGDGWLLIPGDHPLLQLTTLEILIAVWRMHPESIVLPTYEGRRGHPTFFPWSHAADVFELPENVGVNQLLHVHAESVIEVPVDDPTVTFDLDTPEDYAAALKLLGIEST